MKCDCVDWARGEGRGRGESVGRRAVRQAARGQLMLCALGRMTLAGGGACLFIARRVAALRGTPGLLTCRLSLAFIACFWHRKTSDSSK